MVVVVVELCCSRGGAPSAGAGHSIAAPARGRRTLCSLQAPQAREFRSQGAGARGGCSPLAAISQLDVLEHQLASPGITQRSKRQLLRRAAARTAEEDMGRNRRAQHCLLLCACYCLMRARALAAPSNSFFAFAGLYVWWYV